VATCDWRLGIPPANENNILKLPTLSLSLSSKSDSRKEISKYQNNTRLSRSVEDENLDLTSGRRPFWRSSFSFAHSTPPDHTARKKEQGAVLYLRTAVHFKIIFFIF
jgi:hypothetical protein